MSRPQAYDVEKGPKARFAFAQFTKAEFDRFWPELEKLLDAIPHTWRHWTKEHLLDSVAKNTVQVWGIGPPPNAVLILFTSVSIYPTMRVLNVLWAAGSFRKEMAPLIFSTFVNYAQMNNCDEIEIRGRPGWEPHLKNVGFRRDSVNWAYKIPNMRIQ
jgi:hypothetical protein